MPRVSSIEKRIRDIEGFNVKFLNPDETDVRGDRTCGVSYPYSRAAMNSMTVGKWIRDRFLKTYANYKVSVVKADGSPASGQMRLSTLRDTYLVDDESFITLEE